MGTIKLLNQHSTASMVKVKKVEVWVWKEVVGTMDNVEGSVCDTVNSEASTFSCSNLVSCYK